MKQQRARSLRSSVGLVLTITLLVAGLPFVPGAQGQELSTSESGGREEVVDKRTRTSKTYRNEDGSLTTALYSSPVHFRAQGQWEEISSDLVPSERSDYAWENESNSFGVLFKDDLEDDYLQVATESGRFDFSLAGAAAVRGSRGEGRPNQEASPEPTPSHSPQEASSPETTPTPEATTGEEADPNATPEPAGTQDPPQQDPESTPHEKAEPSPAQGPPADTAPRAPGPDSPGPASGASSRFSYERAFPGVDLRYDVVPEGVKETLVLENAQVPTRYRFQVDPPAGEDVSVEELPDGSWAFYVVPDEDPAFVLAAPYLLEDTADGEDKGVASAPDRAHVDMDVVRTGDRFAVDLAVDPQWLRDPARSFPVLLDPTIVIQPSSQDADWAWHCPGCTPFQSEDLSVGSGKQSTTTGDTRVYRAGVQFPLSDIPADANVTGASLKMYWNRYCISVDTGWCNGSSQRVDAHRMTAAWSPSTTASGVSFDATALSSFTLGYNAPAQWLNWDVTNTVKSWQSGTAANHGFLLRKDSEPLNGSGPVLISRRHVEASLHPMLEVTYTSDAVTLLPPDTLHSDGADLEWTSYSGPSGAPFQKYEVHRSGSSGFSPSPSSLLATITDVNTTTYRDTTAAPSKSFTYKIVANSSASNSVTVALPADGQASKTLQPDAADGKMTRLYESYSITNCANYGADHDSSVGTDAGGKRRTALAFELADMPTGATVTSATLSLWQKYDVAYDATIDVHRLTRAWREGTGPGSPATCTRDGATWYEADGGTNWTNQGGDFDAVSDASLARAANAPEGWNNFDVASLVQEWVGGQAPNLGFLLKMRDEAQTGDRTFRYHSDDLTTSPSLRPKLAITYADGSHAQGPTVSVASPAALSKVSGGVMLAAAASDDRRVDSVEFFVDGASKGTDTSAPFEATWNTTSADNGSHTVTATATDDAGNDTTSDPVTFTVENSDPPATGITAPAANATVSGTNVAVSANATDDFGIQRVEFFFDGNRIGQADTTSPYSVSWDTLDGVQPAYDGAHELTARAYDTHGQMTISAPRSVTVANAAGTKYQASWSSTAVPQAMKFDPALSNQQTHPIDVTITNDSLTTWSKSDMVLRPTWRYPDGTLAATGSDVALAADVRKGRSETLRVNATPPALPEGVDKAQFILRLDLFESSTSTYFANKGTKPLDNPVIVNKAIMATALGLERYYHYEGEALGAGMGHLTNVASGNSLLSWTPFSSPGRGLSTVVDLTYNSLEDRSESPVGNNFSLSISSLTRFGIPLDIHPNKADELAARTNQYIEFTDGDGTTHRFTRNGNGGWDEPAGVHLYLRQYSTTDLSRKWALTRPDRVTFFYNDLGFPTSVEDRNGNRIEFTLEDVPPAEDPGGVKKRITKITDAAGLGTAAAPNRSFDIDYYSKDEAKKPQVRGKIQTITDHTGSALSFDYYEDGNLLRITQQGGAKADGTPLSDRSFVFTYTTSDGSGAAITDANTRKTPDPKTPSQSSRLFSVLDPRGTETTFTYFGPGSSQDRWKLKSRTNRSGNTTSFAYDFTNRVTSVTAPLSRITKYAYDTDGKVTRITDPLDLITDIAWSGDRHVTKVYEPRRLSDPLGDFTEYAYNANGYPTDVWDQLRNRTTLTYDNIAVDANDVSTKWKSGRAIAHISQLRTKTSPRGTATSTPVDDYQHSFDYDAKGNLVRATEPEGSPRYFTTHAYNTDGTLASTTDANSKVTSFNTYDANGLATKVTDAKGEVTQFGYDDDGLMRWLQDPLHASRTGGDPRSYRTYFDYDSFHRLGRQSTPKDSEANAPLIWSGAVYDANDNVTLSLAPEFGAEFVAGPRSAMTYDAMDRLVTSTNPDGEETKTSYDAAGRATVMTSPKGVATANTQDHAVFYAYDGLDRATRVTRYDTSVTPAKALNTHLCYSIGGDLVSQTAPKADVSSVDCAAPPGYTTRFEYDRAHRRKAVVDPLGHRSTTGYDADGNPETTTNELGDTTTSVFDQRGQVTKVTSPLTATRNVVTANRYDGVGNLVKQISPRAWDASADKATFTDFVTSYTYDAVNQLIRVELPSAGAAKTYVHRDYDPNGNLVTTTLPDAAVALGSVPGVKKTTLELFDTGWIQRSSDGVNPAITYDYNARGLQVLRKAGTDASDPGERWSYYIDDMVKERRDRVRDGTGGQPVTYEYDANNQMTKAIDGSGVTAPTEKAVETLVTYNPMDQVAKVRHRKGSTGNYGFTTFAYDLNGNLSERGENGTESDAGAIVTPAKRHTFAYDQADWLTTQTDSLASGCQRIKNVFTATGVEDTREVEKAPQGCDAAPVFAARQSTDWDYFRNGKLKKLVTRSGGLSAPIVEQHDVDYVDPTGNYVNGHRTTDTFFKKGPNPDCNTSSCTTTFTYDAQDRLTREARTGKPATDYTLDDIGNVIQETTGASSTFFNYTGARLESVASGTAGNIVSRNRYDSFGNVDCVTVASYSGACTGATNSQLVKDYGYDYLDRLVSYASYAGGSMTDDASYTYDALNRVVSQKEGHNLAGTAKRRTTDFSYLGLSTQVTQEDFSGDRKYDSKTYSYDAYGHRISITNDAVDNTQDKSYTYAYDVHGSVSMLLDGSSTATVSYGYDSYGEKDSGLSAADGDEQDPLNAFRYTGKRFDSGSGTLDMGARRFGPDSARFLQQDQYMGALSDLGLSLDPLTQNRYSLAGGNPVSFVETDGHRVVADGGGGSASEPTPIDGWAAGAASSDGGGSAPTTSTIAAFDPDPGPAMGAEGEAFHFYDIPATGKGDVQIDFFISDQRAALGLLDGDARGFSSSRSKTSRVRLEFDFDQGYAQATIFESCVRSNVCEDAVAIDNDAYCCRNRIEIAARSDSSIEVNYRFVNSVTAPAGWLEGKVELIPDGNSFDVAVDRDNYPAMEAYHYQGGQVDTLATAAQGPFISTLLPTSVSLGRHVQYYNN